MSPRLGRFVRVLGLPRPPCRSLSHIEQQGRSTNWQRLIFGVGGISLPLLKLCRCQAGSGPKGESEDDDEDDFEYNFAKPPVTPADINFECDLCCKGGLLSGTRPLANITTSSTFSLPVERGWPRDINRPDEVAESMCAVIADRLPRQVASQFGLVLDGAPLRMRSLEGWPRSDSDGPPATLRWWLLPAPLPPLLTLRKLEDSGGSGYILGGLLCAGRPVLLHFTCKSLGVCRSGEEEDERLDLRLTTQLTGLPLAGRAWVIGGRWWFKRVRFPTVRGVLEDFHTLLHQEMMFFFVAALAG